MAKLHRNQMNALSEYVRGIPVEANWLSINFNDLQVLQDQILNAPPWKHLLKRGDFLGVLLGATSNFQKEVDTRARGFVGSISDSPVADLIPKIEQSIVDFLESLPRSYCVCFCFPRFPRFGTPRIELADGVVLLDTSAPAFPAQLLRSHNALGEVLTKGDPTNFERNSVYLEFYVPGFSGISLSSYSPARAYARLKEFVFLGLQKGILREKGLRDIPDVHQTADISEVPPHAVVYRRDDYSKSYRLSIPDDLSRYLRGLRIDESKLTARKASQTILGGDLRVAETPEEKNKALRAACTSIAEFLGIDANNRDAERIRTAIEWCFDADVSENETVSFIQRCIGLEAILGVAGDDDRVRSITDRLSDRYSYLLGGTASERTTLKDQFKRIYNKRSDLVHARSPVLSETDEILSTQATVMLRRVLAKEVDGLLASLRAQRR